MKNKRRILEESQDELYKILKAIKDCTGEVPTLYRRKTELEDVIAAIGYEYQERCSVTRRKREGRNSKPWAGDLHGPYETIDLPKG